MLMFFLGMLLRYNQPTLKNLFKGNASRPLKSFTLNQIPSNFLHSISILQLYVQLHKKTF